MAKLWTPLCDQLGIQYPIFGFAHDVATVAAITNAGGYGVYGATRRFPEEIEAELAMIRSLVGDKPFGVDLVLPPGMPAHNSRQAIEAEIPQGHKDFVAGLVAKYQVPAASGPGMRTRFIRSTEIEQAQIRAVLDSSVNMFACGIGSPPEVMREAKSRGKTTLALIGSPHHVQRALASGVEMLVAQGYDAGAHTGPIGTYSLVPQIVDAAGDIPVLVAGGVATGRHIAAALAMGAAGVWMGTAWLLSKEHQGHMHPVNTQKLKDAGSGDTVITRSESGKTFRQVRSGWSQAWEAEDAPAPLKMPYQDVLVGDLLGAIEEHNIEPLIHSGAGQSIGYFNEVRPVQTIMDELVAEASEVLGQQSSFLRE
ncbi:MAG: NAD(P)H-dependent flavin oxidoreductase YrpB (nitropropane dioxygenase family) [Candidatus Azotimanducaceae bacterium]|jgi:NAD(P)H-dependent flavin oxidoreductase YrpB (nitropropane dioxygenase family)